MYKQLIVKELKKTLAVFTRAKLFETKLERATFLIRSKLNIQCTRKCFFVASLET
jgi:hypothetical protein